jgi:hypothetical protein
MSDALREAHVQQELTSEQPPVASQVASNWEFPFLLVVEAALLSLLETGRFGAGWMDNTLMPITRNEIIPLN